MSDWLNAVWEWAKDVIDSGIKVLLSGLEALIPISAPVDDLLLYLNAITPYLEVANRIVAIDWLLYYFGALLGLRFFLWLWRLGIRIWELIPFN